MSVNPTTRLAFPRRMFAATRKHPTELAWRLLLAILLRSFKNSTARAFRSFEVKLLKLADR